MTYYSSWLLERTATGDVVRLKTGTSTIGRSLTATIRTHATSAYVSRHHAELTVTEDDRLYIKDLGSSNGIFIDDSDKACAEGRHELKKGSHIGMGITNTEEYLYDVTHYTYLVKHIPVRGINNNKQQTTPMVIRHVLPSSPLSPTPSPPDLWTNFDRCSLKVGDVITISDDDEVGRCAEAVVVRGAEAVVIRGADNVVVRGDNDVVVRTEDDVVRTDDDVVRGNDVVVRTDDDVVVRGDDAVGNGNGDNIKDESNESTDIENDASNAAPIVPVKVEVAPFDTNACDKSNNKNSENSTEITAKMSCEEPINTIVLNTSLLSESKKEELIQYTASLIENIINMDEMKQSKPVKFPFLFNQSTRKLSISDPKNLLLKDDIVVLETTTDEEDELIANVEMPVNVDQQQQTAAQPCDEKTDEKEKETEEIQLTIETSISKSPNIFETSKEDSSSADEAQLSTIITRSANNDDKQQLNKCVVNEILSVDDGDKDVEELMFTQSILDEMKTDMGGRGDDDDDDKFIDAIDKALMPPPSSLASLPVVKTEPMDMDFPYYGRSRAEAAAAAAKAERNNPITSLLIISDDDDYDEELEFKVSGWSTKLFSQNANYSQVFELSEDVEDAEDIEDIVNGYKNSENADISVFNQWDESLKQTLYNSEGDESSVVSEIGSISPLIRKHSKVMPISNTSSESETEFEINKSQRSIKNCKVRLPRNFLSTFIISDEDNVTSSSHVDDDNVMSSPSNNTSDEFSVSDDDRQISSSHSEWLPSDMDDRDSEKGGRRVRKRRSSRQVILQLYKEQLLEEEAQKSQVEQKEKKQTKRKVVKKEPKEIKDQTELVKRSRGRPPKGKKTERQKTLDKIRKTLAPWCKPIDRRRNHMDQTKQSFDRTEEREELNNKKTDEENKDNIIENQIKDTKDAVEKPIVCDEKAKESIEDLDKKLTARITNECRRSISEVRNPPILIEAPCLPLHKGKLRGVSAAVAAAASVVVVAPKDITAEAAKKPLTKKTLSLREQMQQDETLKDLKRKWIEKPSVVEKERIKTIKIDRKERLQQLANKDRQATIEEPLKRKSCDTNPEGSSNAKKPKVKVTEVNRGAFLLNETSTTAKVQSHSSIGKSILKSDRRLPKKDAVSSTSRKEATSTTPDEVPSISKKAVPNEAVASTFNDDVPTTSKKALAAAASTPEVGSFEWELMQNDIINFKTHKVVKRSVTPKPVCKEAVMARAQRTTNKITFATMEQNIKHSIANEHKLEDLEINRSNLAKTVNDGRPRKTVRFHTNLEEVRYIDRVRSGPIRKVNMKDSIYKPLLLQDRRQRIRHSYKFYDYTDEIITRTLSWSNDWLVTRNADTTSACQNDVYPMPLQFHSYEHYKSILMPLLKMEYITTLQRDYMANERMPVVNGILEFVSDTKNRLCLVTKVCVNIDKPWKGSRYDLVLVDFLKYNVPSSFAYMSRNRKVGNFYTIILEILTHNHSKELLNTVREVTIRPVIDNLRVIFGPYNAMEQLVSMPLYKLIMNPLELLRAAKKGPTTHCHHIEYRGYDQMNHQQGNIILNTYKKIIDATGPNITLIQGPPGTGKSQLIANLALQIILGHESQMLDYRILICAQSNYAIDVIASKLQYVRSLNRNDFNFTVLRYGILDKMKPEIAETISLQKYAQHDQIRKFMRAPAISSENIKHLGLQIEQLKAEIKEISRTESYKDTVEEEKLLEKHKKLDLMVKLFNGALAPDAEMNLYSHYLHSAHIVCTTLPSCVKLHKYVDYFDICIIDEATQSIEPWTLVPLQFGINSLVLVGDSQQLPATVLSKKASDLGLGTSLFTRIQECLEQHKIKNTNGVFNTLETQYRMHPEICAWPNAYFYKNLLKNDAITFTYKSRIVPFSILNLAYSQNDNCGNGNFANDLEAEFVIKLIKGLDPYLSLEANTYGIITPYAKHRDTLNKAIESHKIVNTVVNTIDSYQGLEKDVIIISNGRTRGIGFLSNYQRLNVALTRPKKCLILCGNFANLVSVPAWLNLLTNARERGLYHEISVDCVNDMKANVIAKLKRKH